MNRSPLARLSSAFARGAARAVAAIAAGLAVTAAVAETPASAPRISALEQRWIDGAAPVIRFAHETGLPLDIVVQPQPLPGAAPLALAYIGGRCKLVLQMRGNDEAPAALARIPPALQDAALEMMAAHELGHCRRYVDGAWHGLPAGFRRAPGAAPDEPADAPDIDRVSPELRDTYLRMRATRREEGYADLVALAWVQQRRPQQYAQLHAWLMAERLHERIPGSHHDTVAWLKLASDHALPDGTTLFSGVLPLWAQGLANGDD